MKKNITILIIGLSIGYFYNQYNEVNREIQVYGSRDIDSDIKKEVSRVNTILSETEKRYLNKTNVPKPSPPLPDIACKCGGAGVIVQPDGNKSQCQCFKDSGTCKCKPKEEPQVQAQPQIQHVPVNP